MAQVSVRPDTYTYQDVIETLLDDRRAMLAEALSKLAQPESHVSDVAEILVECLRGGQKILLAGNGGSAAEAQHFAAELVGRFLRDRAPYAALSLTTDTSILTAVGNDYGYDDVFSRQVFALGQPGDVLLAFSTSGESENLIRAALAARQRQMVAIGVTGEHFSRLHTLCDVSIRVASNDTAIVQELHTVVTHLLCAVVELALEDRGPRP